MYLFVWYACIQICKKKEDETEMEMETDKGERSVDQSCMEGSSFQIRSPSKFLQMFMLDPEERGTIIHVHIHTYIHMYVYMYMNRMYFYRHRINPYIDR